MKNLRLEEILILRFFAFKVINIRNFSLDTRKTNKLFCGKKLLTFNTLRKVFAKHVIILVSASRRVFDSKNSKRGKEEDTWHSLQRLAQDLQK